ncbi:MAG TPA: hypothetical protein VH853_15880 [Polyangia bacterium]|nr:hypothetical protein [Polyangia bacterium]
MTATSKSNCYRRCALLALAAAALGAGACKKEAESLVLVSLTATPADAALISATITVDTVTKTFDLASGLSATSPTMLGVYLPADVVGSFIVSATASDGSACGGYRGSSSAPVAITAGGTASAVIVLVPGSTCPIDAGGGADGGRPKVAPPTLAHCTEYVHDLDTTAACVNGNANTDVEITDIAFSPDGKLLYSAGADSRVKIWTWDGANLTAEGHELDTSGGFTCLAASPDNTLVATGAQNGELKIWNVGGSWSIAANLLGNTNDVNGVAFSPDSIVVYSADADSNLNIYNRSSLSPLSEVFLRATAMPFTLSSSPPASDGSYWLSIGYSDGDASLLSIDSGGYTGYEIPFTVSTNVSGVYTARFSPDGTMIEAGTADGSFGLWSVPLPGSGNPRAPQIAVGSDSVFGGAFDPTSSYVAITGGLGVGTRKIGLWTVATGLPRATVPTTLYAQRPTAVAFSPDGTTLAVGEHNCGKLLICVN